MAHTVKNFKLYLFIDKKSRDVLHSACIAGAYCLPDVSRVFLVSAAEVCSLFGPGRGETPTESALSSAERGKKSGQSILTVDPI